MQSSSRRTGMVVANDGVRRGGAELLTLQCPAAFHALHLLPAPGRHNERKKKQARVSAPPISM